MIEFTATSKLFFSVMLLLLTLTLPSVADDLNVDVRCGNNSIMKGVAMESNFKEVQISLVKNVGKTGRNISWYGQEGDTIYGLAQCRGNLNASTCQACVSGAVEMLELLCNGSFPGSIDDMKGCFVTYHTYNSADNSSSPIANLLSELVDSNMSSNAVLSPPPPTGTGPSLQPSKATEGILPSKL